MPKFTKEQTEAITLSGKNIIVSAGAGSGKTAVLTERVINILKKGVHINELLILTFTKAAAGEMKERIRSSLKKHDELKQELMLIEEANITTFDSFALRILKKYHYTIKIDKNIKITPSSLLEIKKKEILDDIFEELYKTKEQAFLQIIDDFCVKDDKNIKEQIFKIANKLELIYNKEEYLDNYINDNYSESKIENFIIKYKTIIDTKKEELQILRDKIYYLDANDYITKLDIYLEEIINANNLNDLIPVLNKKIPTLPRGSSEELKNAKENFSKCIKEIKELLNYESTNQMKQEITETKNMAQIIIKVLKKYFEKLETLKTKNNYYEFTDVAIKAIKILSENEEIREYEKSKLHEILIDEYQDTNDLQEKFISLISNNNVYMVGDVKQSIYRFRNANPNIFRDKYNKYSNNDDGVKIDLLKNFRSRSEVINDINLIFRQIMDNDLCGIDYIKTHQMIFGNSAYETIGKKEENSDSEIWTYDEINEYSHPEIEAFLIAKDIKTKITNKYKIFDKDSNSLRNITYNDFCILIDRGTYFDLYKKIFEYLNVPLTLYKDENLNLTIELSLFKNIIDFIIKIKNKEFNKKFKYDFISIARSFLYNLKDDEIFTIINENTIFDNIIYEDLKPISNIIDSLDNYHILIEVLNKVNFYNKILESRDIEKKQIITTKILELAISLDELNYNIYEFNDYLEQVINEKYKVTYEINKDNNESVKIMTIHKSKGLEYPICYFSLLDNKFNLTDTYDKILYSKDEGIILPIFNEGIKETILHKIFKEEYLLEEISEKIRLFYVALTRAREKMIFLTPKKEFNEEKENIVSIVTRKKYKTFSDIIYSIGGINSKIKYLAIEKTDFTKDYLYPKESNKMTTYIEEKIEVEELNTKENNINKLSYSKKSNDLPTITEIKNMKYGELIHEYLEYIDFKNPELELIDDSFARNIISNFLKSELMNNIKNANIYKEHEFIYNKDNIEYHGIIDLMLEYSTHIDIIDYKLKNTTDSEYIKQLNGYKEYIEMISRKEVNIYLYGLLEGKLISIENKEVESQKE